MSAKQQVVAALGRVALAVERQLVPRTRLGSRPVQCVLILEYMLPLGTCVHMTPVFEALRQRQPGLTIIVATRGLALQLLRHSPYVDHLLETPDPLTDLPASVASLRQQLRTLALHPDCALTGAGDQRTRIALLAALACSGWRGGFTVANALYQAPLRYNPDRSLIENNLRLAELAGAPAHPREPKIFYSEADADRARALLAPARANGNPVLILVTQNSGGQRTGWHAERWHEVLRHARQELGYALVFVGTAADRPAVEALRATTGGISLAGETTVPVLAAVLALADMVISIDTGTMHVGRAVGVPMVVLGPSWQKPLEWLPLGKPQVCILRGEDRIGMPPDYHLDEITAASVIGALEELTRLFPQSEPAREARLQAGLSSIDLLPGT